MQYLEGPNGELSSLIVLQQKLFYPSLLQKKICQEKKEKTLHVTLV